jgi:4-hydroxybutyrate CoA-transferase
MPGDSSPQPVAAGARAWRARLGPKLVAPQEAVARVRSGDLVRLALGPVPRTLVAALAQRRSELQGVRVLQGATAFPLPWATDSPGWEEHIAYLTDYITPLVRHCLDARRGDLVVTDYAIGSKVLDGGRHNGWGADAVMIPVTEPDVHGQVHFPYGPWYSRGLLNAAKLRIAEIVGDGIRPRGESAVPLDAFDLFVESQEPPFRLPSAYPRPLGDRLEQTEAIGVAVAKLVNDRDTLQIGTGSLSACMGNYLTGKRDLGIDSEILVPSLVELVKCGAATGRYKTSRAGVATGAFIVPGADLSFCHDNEKIALYDIEWVNHLPRIASIPNLVAINQALSIDLTGQVAAESIGAKMYTGPGGQLVWTMGALFARGGRAIHVLPSTARGATVSRIVPQLAPGTIVTVPRTFVDYVVTEYGVANLQGLTQRERALALVDLAHPSFREQLRSEARRLFWP